MSRYEIKLPDGRIIYHELWRCFICNDPMKRGIAKSVHPNTRTKHHLRPQAEADMAYPEYVYVHQRCHNRIHQLFSNQELFEKYFNAELLKLEFQRRLELKLSGKYKNYNYREALND